MSIAVNHVGIAVRNLDEAIETYNKLLGVEPSAVHREAGMDMGIAMYSLGSSKLEVMEPVGEGPVSRFIEKRGEGIHHICFEVEDIDEKLKSLVNQGMPLIDKEPRQGLEGRLFFVHPKATAGVLIEFLQKDK